MQIIVSAAELTEIVSTWQKAGLKVGFVPTMGYLHEGHLSLVRQAKAENDKVIVSIFVNPTQFGPQEDFDKYPRDLEHDKKMLEKVACDILFLPSVEEIYPEGLKISVFADKKLSNVACGLFRPGHFDGVVTVVARLFDIVHPDKAYFGLKDYQQFLIIKQMVKEKKYPIQIIGCPIVREPDGLAMSSRNKYLSPSERKDALVLFEALQEAKKYRDRKDIVASVQEKISKIKSARLQYVEVLDRDTLQPIEKIIPGHGIILLAVYIGNTRLIDNQFV